MKILYLGHYKEQSGWANAAINNILALDSVGVDVVCKNIDLTGSKGVVPDRIYELENKSSFGSDYCIQHILPHHLSGTSVFKKNVAYCPAESIHTQQNVWHSNLELMDEVWVANKTQEENLQKFINKPTKVIPHAFDCSIYKETRSDIFKDNTFRFYNISDINQRKNIESIIRCYFHCFDINDNVELLLKVKKYGLSKEQLASGMSNIINEIKNQMRMHQDNRKYPEIITVTEHLPTEGILDIHSSCDCYVGTSRGEGWSIPSFEAMAFGNTPICSKEGGPLEFIDPNNKNTGTLVNGVYDICNQQDGAFSHIFTGRELWFHASEKEICDSMKYYYENRDSRNKTDGIKQCEKFDYKVVGNLIKDGLCQK